MKTQSARRTNMNSSSVSEPKQKLKDLSGLSNINLLPCKCRLLYTVAGRRFNTALMCLTLFFLGVELLFCCCRSFQIFIVMQMTPQVSTSNETRILSHSQQLHSVLFRLKVKCCMSQTQESFHSNISQLPT